MAYKQIRQAILDGSIPIGTKLTVANLASNYELSPMPVREALTKLTQEGLVQSTPHQGARVAEFNYYEHLESSLIRACLESQLFQTALQFYDKIDLGKVLHSYERLCQLLDEGDLLSFSQERHALFQIIFSAAPLEEVKLLAESYYERYQIFHFFVIKIAEEDGLDRTWELLSEIKTLVRALETNKFDVCLAMFSQIQKNDFLIFARYLINSLEKADSSSESGYHFLWNNEKLTPEKKKEIRHNIEMFIRIRLGNTSLLGM